MIKVSNLGKINNSTLLTLVLFFLSCFFFVLFLLRINNGIEFKNTYLTKEINNFVNDNVLGNNINKTVDIYDEFNTLTNELKKENGTYSIYIKDLVTNKIYTYNQDKTYYAASLYKLPVGISVLKNIENGKLTLETTLPYLPKHYTDGTGYINQTSYGTLYTIDTLLTALYKDSDNVAQNILLDYLDVDTKNVSESFPNNGKTDFYHLNITSTKEVSEYIEYIFTSNYLNEEHKQYLLNVMNNTSFDYLLANTINTHFSHKIGISGGLIHDCGITKDKRLIICVMSDNTTQDNFVRVGKLVLEFVSKL